MQKPTLNIVTQGEHGTYHAVDYSASPDIDFYAPEDGKITFYASSGNCGNNLQMQGATGRHGFCHLETSYVTVGQQVKRGQKLGKMGYTGYTEPAGPSGRHLHWVIDVNGVYKYPPSLVNQEFIKEGGSMPSSQTPADETTIKLEFNNGLFRDANAADIAGLLGQTVEAVQRTVGSSSEHSDLLGKNVLGAKARELLGNDVSPQNMEQKMKDKYGGSGEFVETKVYVKKV